MSIVYKCGDIVIGRTVALKVIQPQLLSDQRWHARFIQEARTVGQLNHPGIVKLHEFNFIEDVPYIVMDYIEGVSLAGLIAQEGSMPMDRALRIVGQIVDALEHAHQQGVVHRDLKPSNIMVRQDDSTVIVDFGIAKVNAANMQVAATQTGEVFGSPAYMSPEQINGKVVDARADQYALGCILFECLTAAPPFVGESAVEIMLEHRSHEPASLQEASLGKRFPQGLELAVKRMLAKEPQERFPDMSAVKQSLSEVAEQLHSNNNGSANSKSVSAASKAGSATTAATPTSAWASNMTASSAKKKLALLVGVAVFVVLLVVGAAVSFFQNTKENGAGKFADPTKILIDPQMSLSASTSTLRASKPLSQADQDTKDAVQEKEIWLRTQRVTFDEARLISVGDSRDSIQVRKVFTDADMHLIRKHKLCETIDCSNCPNVTGSGLRDLLVDGNKVTSLYLHNCGITDDGLKSLSKFPNLQNLDISSNTKLTGECLKTVGNELHHLTKLEARNIHIAGGLKYLMQNTQLQELHIEGSKYLDKDLPILAKLKTRKVTGIELR